MDTVHIFHSGMLLSSNLYNVELFQVAINMKYVLYIFVYLSTEGKKNDVMKLLTSWAFETMGRWWKPPHV